MHLRTLKILLTAIPAIALSSCTLIHVEGVDETGEGQACTETADCKSSCGCKSGYCGVLEKCETTGDCGNRESCIAGRCMPFCTKNGDCHGGQFCLAGSCRVTPTNPKTCTNSNQCGFDTCINGFCVRPCTQSADCNAHESCTNGFCGSTSVPQADAGAGGGNASGGGSAVSGGGAATGGGTALGGGSTSGGGAAGGGSASGGGVGHDNPPATCAVQQRVWAGRLVREREVLLRLQRRLRLQHQRELPGRTLQGAPHGHLPLRG